MTLVSLAELQTQVGAWSAKNFGAQISAVTGEDHGSLHPLLGIVEEVGELSEGGLPSDELDAVGDIVVYLADFASRETDCVLPDPEAIAEDPHADAFLVVVQAVGRLCHAVLKRHQGIRGLADFATYKQARDAAVALLVQGLAHWCQQCHQMSLLEVAQTTWQQVVAKRDWQADPGAGGGHSHG